MSLPGTNAHRNAMPRRTSVQRHQRIPYAQSIAPYPQSSVAMFSRASNAVMESLSWPQKQFLKWVRTDVVKAATAAEDHLNLSDHNSQEPIWPQAPPSREPSKAVISSLDRSSFNLVLDTLDRSTINGMLRYLGQLSTLKSLQISCRHHSLHHQTAKIRGTSQCLSVTLRSRPTRPCVSGTAQLVLESPLGLAIRRRHSEY